MLTPEQFRSLLKRRLGVEIINCEFERMTYPKKSDTRPDASWRDSLLRTFSVRRAGAEAHKADAVLIAELKNFTAALEAHDRTADLYCWQANTADGFYSGWATEERVIYAAKSQDHDA